MQKLWAIAANTFRETVRQPVFSVLVWCAAGWLMLSPALAAFSLESGKDNKIMQDVGLSTMLLYGLLASTFSATSVIVREIESFTVLTVISKPVSRPLFLLGKYLGVCAAVLVGFYLLSLVFLMVVRHGVLETVASKYDQPVLVFSGLALGISLIASAFGNYVYGWHFPTALLAWATPLGTLAVGLVLFLGPQWDLQSPTEDFGNLQIIYALILIFLAVMVLAAVAVAIATRFGQVMTLTLCAGVFVLGLLSDYYFGRHLDEGFLYQAAYAAVPNFQYFWVGDALTQDLYVPGEQVLRVASYAGLYVLAVLALGVSLFQTREVG